MTGKHATRMVLIPEEEYIVLKENKNNPTAPKYKWKQQSEKLLKADENFMFYQRRNDLT